MLNITAVTLAEKLQIGFLAMPKAVPHVDKLAAYTVDAFKQLKQAKRKAMTTTRFDYDWLIVGSGFGGSVSALRLAEKGYKVGVLECGRRFRDEDFAKSTWQLRKFLWAPYLGLRGILRLTPFKDVFIANGSGVGGGSLVYANTLYRAAPEFFANPQWAGLDDWSAALAPHYATAERMLGVNKVPFDSDNQLLLKEARRRVRRRRTRSRARRARSTSASRT